MLNLPLLWNNFITEIRGFFGVNNNNNCGSGLHMQPTMLESMHP